MSWLGGLLLFMSAASTLSSNSTDLNDCISAELQCENDSLCHNTYLKLKNCSRADAAYLLNAPECQEAAELISQTSIFQCKCHHNMSKEELCLKIFWTVRPAYIAASTLSSNSMDLNDCISAELQCENDSLCHNTYLKLKNCSRADAVYLLNAPECQEAAELISQTSIFQCKCHHNMRKEELCLKIFWTVRPAYIADYLVPYDSPYADKLETTEGTKHKRLLTVYPNSDPFKTCASEASVCSSINKCQELKSGYVIHCTTTKPDGSCDQRKCRSHLRYFIKRNLMELTKRFLICSCDHDTSCGERRRQNIVPECSFEENKKKNCLQLYDFCMTDNLCKSRLLDYKKQCNLFEKSKEGCSPKQYDKCIKSYIRMIGTEITPNFINNSTMDVSLWCTCEGSGNKLEECNAFLGMFTSNRCLQKAFNADFTQSMSLTVNDEQRSLKYARSGTNLDILIENKEKWKSSNSASGVSAPSFTLLSPVLFGWLIKVVSCM